LASGLRIVAVASLFLTVNAYQVGALAGLEVFRSAGLAAAALGLLHVAICAIGGCYFGLQGALWGLLASSVVRWWFFRRILQREMAAQGIPFSWSGWRTQRAILTGFAVPAAICGISSMPALWSINALLARQPGGYALLAAYSAAFQLKSIVTLLPYMFNNVGLSLLNHQRGIGDSAGYLRAFWYNVLLGGGAALAGAVILSVAGRPVLRLYGGTFDDAYVPLLILLGSAVFEGFAIGLFQIVQSDGRMWSAFWRVVLPRDLLSILLASLLVDSYGIIGVATAYSIAWFIGSMLILAYVRRLGFRFSTGFSAHA
jgi:O-antigen/teichoic acid export membrane protein